MQGDQGLRDGAGRSRFGRGIYQRLGELRLEFPQRKCADKFRGALLSLDDCVRAGPGHGDDRRIKPADRQPGISVAVVAVGDFEVTLPAGEPAQVPSYRLRHVVARRKGFGDKIVFGRDSDALASGVARRLLLRCRFNKPAPLKQTQADDVFPLRRPVRITVVTGEEEI